MPWSNVYMKVTRANSGDVVGEGLLMGWQGQIGLSHFDWTFEVKKQSQKTEKDFADQLKLLEVATMIGDTDQEATSKEMTIKKGFDVSSAELQTLVDHAENNELEVVPKVVITVLHTAHGRAMIMNLPGFQITLEDCVFSSCDIEMRSTDKGINVEETYKILFRAITIDYLKVLPAELMQITVPTLSFTYRKSDAIYLGSS